MEPRIQYARTKDGVSIAFATMGEGMPLVRLPAFPWSHIQLSWQILLQRRFNERLAETARLVLYDARGTGSSDRHATDFSLEAHTLDLEAVVNRLQLERFGILARGNSAPVGVTYAVRNPERVSRLVLLTPHMGGSQMYESSPQARAFRALREVDFRILTETVAHEILGWEAGEEARRFAAFMRECTSPEVALATIRAVEAFDVAGLLPEVRLPTLVLAVSGAWWPPIEAARSVAARIPDARLVVVDRTPGLPAFEDTGVAERIAAAITEFLSEGEEVVAARAEAPEAGAFRTVLFTDVEGSTALTQRLGDAKARDVLREHERIVREALRAHGGSEVKTMGDGFMASFASATRALECAIAMQRAFEERNASLPAHPVAKGDSPGREPVEGRAEPQPSAHGSRTSPRADRDVGASPEPIRVRIGLNAGEPIAEEDDLFGTAVIEAARIAAAAKGGEILVSNVVKELAKGKDFRFTDRGETLLKGFDEPVRLYEVCWREEG